MASSEDIFCEPCEHNGTRTIASKWCNDCEEGYCDECVKSHKVTKILRSHHVILIQDRLKVSHCDVSDTCQEHRNELEFYCPQHYSILCLKCVQTKHNNCEITRLKEVSKQSKTSSATMKLEEDVNFILQKLTQYIEDNNNEKLNLKSQENSIRGSINEFRQNINKLLDRLQEVLLKELRKHIEESLLKTEKYENQLRQLITSLCKMKEDISVAKELSSEKQCFIAVTQNNEKMQKLKETANSIVSDFSKSTLSFKENEKLLAYLDLGSIETLGEIEVLKQAQPLPCLEPAIGHAQTDVSSPTDISNMQLKLKQTININDTRTSEDMSLTSCVLMPNKKMVFVDNNGKRLIVHNADGSYISNILLVAKPFDACFIDTSLVAVTLPSENKVNIINIDLRQVRDISVIGCPFGIAYTPKTLYVLGNNGINIIDLQGTILRSILIENRSVYNIAIFQNKICFTCWSTGSVNVIDESGKGCWDFTDKRVRKPKGFTNNYSISITNDRHGNVFVALVDSNAIMVISKDGKSHRIINDLLSQLRGPSGVSYLSESNQLLVCNVSNGKAFLYDIIHPQ